MRLKERQRELEEEKRIAEYAKKRDATVKARQAEQRRKFEEKQALRQRMIDKALAEMNSRKDREDELLNKHIEEARVKAEQTEELKRQKRAKLKAGIDKHRGIYLRKQAELKRREKEEDKMFQQYWKDKNKTIVRLP